jgi:ATP-dependent DNA helicase RecG
MIALCREAGLPEPDFRQDGGQFVMTLWRDWLTGEVIAELGLNERQKAALDYVKERGHITNKEYRALTGATDRTSLRDLDQLLKKNILEKIGETGRGTHYVFRRKPDRKPPNRT